MGGVLAILAASLLGSVHCAAMCGGFVCLYAGSAVERSRAVPHAAYNLGRLAAYATLGAIAGAAGSRIDRLGEAAGWGRAAGIVAGSLMVAWGLARLAATFGVRIPSLAGGPGVVAPLGRLLAWSRSRGATVRAAVTGLASALLPCGWLWVFVVTAGAAGSALGGVVVMTVFWLGTLPVMLTLALGVQRGFGPLTRRLPSVSAAALVLLGALSIAGRVRIDPLRAANAHRQAHATHDIPAGPAHDRR